MKPVVLFFALACIFWGAAHAPDTPQVQAKLLDHNGYWCANRFFGAFDLLFLLRGGRQSSDRLRKDPNDANWTDSVHTNWLTK